jgi:hypothetical protein
LFIIPYCEPHGSHHEAGDAQAVGQWLGQVEHLTGDEYVGAADGGIITIRALKNTSSVSIIITHANIFASV